MLNENQLRNMEGLKLQEIKSPLSRLSQGNLPDLVRLNGRDYEMLYRSGDITVWNLLGKFNSIPTKTLLLKVE